MLSLILLCISLSISLIESQAVCTNDFNCFSTRQFCVNNVCGNRSCADSSTSCPFAPYGNEQCFFSQCRDSTCVILACGQSEAPGSVCSTDANADNFACTLPCVNNVDCGNDQIYCVNQRCINVGCTIGGGNFQCPGNFRPQDCRLSQCSITGVCRISNCSFGGRVCDPNVGCVLPTSVPTTVSTPVPTTRSPTISTGSPTPVPTTRSPSLGTASPTISTGSPTPVPTTRSPTIDTPREVGIIAFIFAFLVAIVLVVLICYFLISGFRARRLSKV